MISCQFMSYLLISCYISLLYSTMLHSSQEQLAKHNTDENAWMAIHGLVLDLNKEWNDGDHMI